MPLWENDRYLELTLSEIPQGNGKLLGVSVSTLYKPIKRADITRQEIVTQAMENSLFSCTQNIKPYAEEKS